MKETGSRGYSFIHTHFILEIRTKIYKVEVGTDHTKVVEQAGTEKVWHRHRCSS